MWDKFQLSAQARDATKNHLKPLRLLAVSSLRIPWVWAKAVAGFLEVGSLGAIVNAFENDPDDLLHDFIAGGGNASSSLFSIGFWQVDRSDGFELELLRSHLLDDVLDHAQREPIDGLSVRSRRHIPRSRFDPFIGQNVQLFFVPQALEVRVDPLPVCIELS
jgi:hypothetical protein